MSSRGGNTQLKLDLHRLEELEYLLLHRGGRGQSFVYELLYDGDGKGGKPLPLWLDRQTARLVSTACGSGRLGDDWNVTTM